MTDMAFTEHFKKELGSDLSSWYLRAWYVTKREELQGKTIAQMTEDPKCSFNIRLHMIQSPAKSEKEALAPLIDKNRNPIICAWLQKNHFG